MKLTVRNVARISLAEIELGGITVISGSNGTGKSTISRSLMTLASVSKNISELVQVECVNSVFHSLRKSFAKHGADILYPQHFLRDSKNDWMKWLSKEWWAHEEHSVNWIIGEERILVFPEDFETKENISQAIDDARPDIFSVLDRPEPEYVDFICGKSMTRALNGQIKPVFLDSDVNSEIKLENNGSEISLSFTDGNLSSTSGIGRSFSPSTIYMEPLNFVDFVNSSSRGIQDRYTARRFCVCNAISKKPSESGLSIEEARELSEAKRIVDRIVRIIRGSLVDENKDVRFSEKFSDGATRQIDVLNIASGMKTMAAMVRMVENRSIRRGSMLIVDEPETNLHPDWQVKFAIFLILLCRDLGVTLLINTHSPYFLQAIWKYTKKTGVASHFYNMIQGDTPDSFATDDVSSNIDCVFKTMSEPFNNLMGE